ncbi:L-ascorbate metabolism protein UlaG, beta-lactamase superfamily [Saccharopolyspora kobensis]|uniref:L-ascorbate metabolism protein UlaG, beta-lactamase superfamily n=1 Tax=Saccharopolyspora kobensis TaxID=146035 RepID=A0A1H5TMB5_9PSEU|nr:L-ascorbate metabolism protein UlaG, beta-lactamase superfamily [Saccharopolyspora kobensis]SFC44590.1 L-ascorbate metabolism protein UlaG, beta-lactamase superfamily [Saccharopolyspora kobensis]
MRWAVRAGQSWVVSIQHQPPRLQPSYADRLHAPLPSFRDVMRLMWTGEFRGRVEDADRIPVLRSGLAPVAAQDTALSWVGHSTYVLRMGGATVLTDPVWSSRIPGVPRRLTPPGVAFSELPPIDAVVISHNHYDHLDAPTIQRLPRSTPVLVPVGLGRWFRRRGFTEVVELDWWQSAEVAGLTFDFAPARHWSRRGPRDTCRSLWGSWMITGPRHRVYHAGDSGYGPHFAEIGQRYPDIDVAMVPIGAYDPRWFMRPVHMDPEEAVQAVADLGAAHAATMHWGTFVLTREPVVEPLVRVRKAWREAGHDPDRLWDLAVGESRVLPA